MENIKTEEKIPGNCRNCSGPVSKNFCKNCGEPVCLEKIDRKYILDEIGNVLGKKGGFPYSFFRLLARPGDTVKVYIENDRSKIIKPIVYLLFSILIYTIVKNLLFTPELVEEESIVANWINQNLGYFGLIVCFFMAFFIRLFYKKYNHNIYQVFVLMCFLCGTVEILDSVYNLLFYLFLPISASTLEITNNIWFFLQFAYLAWGVASFFDKKKFFNYIKAFLGILFSIILVIVTGTILELVILMIIQGLGG